jgi:hypothetical protein
MTTSVPTKASRRRFLVRGAATVALLGSAGCGWVLYPERRGRTGGRIDGLVLIVDLLWLLPGILPGVICLVVDFTTGCIYGGGGRVDASAPDENRARAATMTIDLDGAIVATGDVQPDRRAHMKWSGAPDLAALRARGRLVVRAPDDARAEARVGDLI